MKIFTAHGKRIYNINCLGHVFISRQKQTHVGQVILKGWSYNTTFHWSGHFFCMSCICGQQKCKRWCKIKRSESTKIWHPHGSCRGFQANVEIYRVFIEMKSKFGLYSSWHSNCNLRHTLVLKGHYLHNSSQLSSMNFIASDCNLYFTSWLRRHSQKIFLK